MQECDLMTSLSKLYKFIGLFTLSEDTMENIVGASNSSDSIVDAFIKGNNFFRNLL